MSQAEMKALLDDEEETFYSTKAPDEEKPRWADEEDDVAGQDTLKPGDRVPIPEAPPEAPEEGDALVEAGEAQGSAGNGRTPLK